MQLTATAPVQAQHTGQHPRPDFSGLLVAKIDRPGFDMHLHTDGTSRLGNKGGYGSFEDALQAATRYTAGNAPAAGVFAGSDRFYLQSLGHGDHGFDGLGSNNERGISFLRAELRAVVDGAVTVVNDQTNGYTPMWSHVGTGA